MFARYAGSYQGHGIFPHRGTMCEDHFRFPAGFEGVDLSGGTAVGPGRSRWTWAESPVFLG